MSKNLFKSKSIHYIQTLAYVTLVFIFALAPTLYSSQAYSDELSTPTIEQLPSLDNDSASTEQVLETISEPMSCGHGPTATLLIDEYASPIVGANLILSAWTGYQALDDYLVPSTQGNMDPLMMLGRFGKLMFIDFTLASTGMIIQHEVFGHGFRGRSQKVSPSRYTIGPYRGTTYFPAAKYNALSLSEKAAIETGGMEATGILAKTTRDRWLDTNRIDHREAMLYLVNTLDQTTYVLSTKHDKTFQNDGHDVGAYVNTINTWYGKQVTTQRRLRHNILIDYLDPFFFYSLYSAGLYVYEGCPTWEYPMIPIGDIKYLPGLRANLAPYGPEYVLKNYIKHQDTIYQVNLRYGHTGNTNAYGVHLETLRFWTTDLLTFDGDFDWWYQPKLFTVAGDTEKTRSGFAASAIARYAFTQQFFATGQLGYKMTGYMPGEPLKRGIIARIGVGLQL